MYATITKRNIPQLNAKIDRKKIVSHKSKMKCAQSILLKPSGTLSLFGNEVWKYLKC